MWPLWTCGYCPEVVVSITSLTVGVKSISNWIKKNHEEKTQTKSIKAVNKLFFCVEKNSETKICLFCTDFMRKDGILVKKVH